MTEKAEHKIEVDIERSAKAKKEQEGRYPEGEIKWRDKKWAIAFGIVFITYIALGAWMIFQVQQNADVYLKMLSSMTVPKSGAMPAEQLPPVDLNIALILAGASVLGLLCALLLLLFSYYVPLLLVWSGQLLLISSGLTGGGLAMMNHDYFVGAVLITGAVFLILMCFTRAFRDMMLRAAVMIRVVSKIGGQHTNVYIVVIMGVLLQTLLVAFGAVSVVCALIRFIPKHEGCEKGGCGWTQAILCSLFFLFAQNWVSGTVANIIVTTLAGGPYSKWFQEANPLDRVPPSIPHALRYSLTTSLGSMALNALITDIVNLALWFVESIIDSIPGLGVALVCCLGFALDSLASLAEQYNRYVCIVIGINDFQLSYTDAAKRTYAFAKKGTIVPQKHLDKLSRIGNFTERFGSRKPNRMGHIAQRLYPKNIPGLQKNHFKNGLGALLNDALVSNALGAACWGCALIAFVVVYLYMQALDADDDVSFKMMWWEWAFVIYASIVAYAISHVLCKSIEAGVSTLYVCIYDPPGPTNSLGQSMIDVRGILQENCFELYELIEERYPSIYDGAGPAQKLFKGNWKEPRDRKSDS